MKNVVILFINAFIVLTISYSCITEVRDGVILNCKVCGKEISSSVETLRVSPSESEKYQIRYLKGYCESCGNEKVSFTVHVQCSNCSKEFFSSTKTALRKDEKSDEYMSIGYCSSYCKLQGRIINGINHVTESSSETLNNLLDEIENNLNNN